MLPALQLIFRTKIKPEAKGRPHSTHVGLRFGGRAGGARARAATASLNTRKWQQLLDI